MDTSVNNVEFEKIMVVEKTPYKILICTLTMYTSKIEFSESPSQIVISLE